MIFNAEKEGGKEDKDVQRAAAAVAEQVLQSLSIVFVCN